MIQKCSRLPLAIVVLSGLLSWKRPSEWPEVCASLWRRLEDDSIQVSTVYLSFREMRHELKLCFLYLSIFPEDYEIDVEKLIHLLVAEGFIPDGEGLMLEDVARYHIEELIDRSLLEAVRRERGKVMSCRIHDLLRDVAIKKSKELNFVNVYNERNSSTTCCRREVVHHLMNNNYLCDRRVNIRMRSFLFFGEGKGMLESYVETITLKLKLLRVLNLGGLQFIQKGDVPLGLPDVFRDLIHLRYLGIADTGRMNIPDFISNLQFLQTLDASGSNYFGGTTDLSKLTSLRHVIGTFIGELLIGDAVNLQTLRSISSYSWRKLKHDVLINLRDVEIYDRSAQIYEGDRIVTLDLASFSKMESLCVLKLEVKEIKVSSSFRSMDVILPSLESFKLVGTNLQKDVIHALQKLPRLEYLTLQDCVWSVAKMSISAKGFGRLRKLQLFMIRLDVLQIEEQAMPSLRELDLYNRGGREMTLMIPPRLLALSRRNCQARSR